MIKDRNIQPEYDYITRARDTASGDCQHGNADYPPGFGESANKGGLSIVVFWEYGMGTEGSAANEA